MASSKNRTRTRTLSLRKNAPSKKWTRSISLLSLLVLLLSFKSAIMENARHYINYFHHFLMGESNQVKIFCITTQCQCCFLKYYVYSKEYTTRKTSPKRWPTLFLIYILFNLLLTTNSTEKSRIMQLHQKRFSQNVLMKLQRLIL